MHFRTTKYKVAKVQKLNVESCILKNSPQILKFGHINSPISYKIVSIQPISTFIEATRIIFAFCIFRRLLFTKQAKLCVR